MEEKKTIGFALTGSYCTFSKIIDNMIPLAEKYNIVPIFSNNSLMTDTRFGKASDILKKVEEICNRKAITTITEAEPIGPKNLIDALVIAPCTGNTAAKLANGIADTTVTLATKSNLRNNKPVIIAISTNDGLGANAVNIGKLIARKNIYMVPFGQDDCIGKENSLVADFTKIGATLEKAFEKKQLQPVLI